MAVKLTKRRFKELAQSGLDAAVDAAIKANRIACQTGEPQDRMLKFLAARSARGEEH